MLSLIWPFAQILSELFVPPGPRVDRLFLFWSAKKRRKRRKEGKRGKEGKREVQSRQIITQSKSKVIKGKAYRYESSSDSEEYTDEEDGEGGEDGGRFRVR